MAHSTLRTASHAGDQEDEASLMSILNLRFTIALSTVGCKRSSAGAREREPL